MKKLYSRLLIMLLFFLGGSWFIPHGYALDHENLFVTKGIADGSIMHVASRVVPPKIQSITGSPGTYGTGQVLTLTVNFDQAVNVTGGTPVLPLTLTSGTVNMSYKSGSGSYSLTFTYTIQGTDQSLGGVHLSGNKIVLPVGVNIKAGDGTTANTNFASANTSTLSSINVDGVAPVLTKVTPPNAGLYNLTNSTITYVVSYNKPVYVIGTPYINLTIGGTMSAVSYSGGSGTNQLSFSYTVVSPDYANNGVTLGTSIQLAGGTIKDAANNTAPVTLNNVGSSANVNVNGIRPTLTISMTDTNPLNHPFTITIVSSEKLTGLTAANISLSAGSLSNLTTTNNTTFTATVSPPAAAGSGTVSIALNTVTGVASGNKNAASNTLNFSWDKFLPVINSVNVPANKTYKIGDVITFVVNFSEPVYVNLATTPYVPLNIGSSTVRANYVSGSGGKPLTFSYTVQANDLDNDGIDVTQNTIQGVTSIKDAAGNDAILIFGNIGNLPGVLVDGVKPYISSVSNPADGYYNTGSNPTMTFFVVFSEPIHFSGIAKLSINIGGSIKTMTTNTLYGQNMLQFVYTVVNGDTDMDGIAYAGFDASGATITDFAGNPASVTFGSQFTAMPNVRVNTTHPTVVLSTTAPSLTNQPFTVKATFPEAVTGMDASDFTVTNGTAANLVVLDSKTYTVTVTPTSDGVVTVSLPVNKVVNIGDNGNLASTGNISLTYDGTAPVISTVTNPADGMYNAGSNKTLAFDVVFSEPVNVTGTPTLAIVIGSDTKLMNGTLTGGNTLHFEYTVADGDQDMDGIAYGALTATVNDLAGNPATIDNSKFGAMPNVLVNTTHPGVVLSTTAASLTNQPFTVTAQFTEAVHDLTIAGFTVGNGTASNLTSTDQITYTFTVTPTADGTVTVSLPADQALNIGNNGNTVSTGNISLTYDATAPVISTVTNPADGMYNAGSNKTLAFDVVFSEPVNVTGTPTLAIVIGSDTKLMNGTLTGGNTLHFEYTVADGDHDMDGIAYGAFTANVNDLAGNPATIDNTKFTAMPNVLVNTTHPGVVLSTTAASLTNQPFTATATFTEAVHDLTIGGFSVGNATISDLTSTDQITYTFTVTPTADGTVTVSLPADQALNIGNNGNTVSTGNISLTYDATAPVISTVTNPADGMYNAGSNKTLAFDVVFSEPINVTGTPTLEIVIGSVTKLMNGTLTGGNTLHFEYTVVDGDQDMDGIAYGAFTATVDDLAGNPATIDNTKFTAMPNVLVNTTHPGVVLSTTATSLINQPFTATATFTEAVHNLTIGGFSVGNATISNLNSTDQITYTFTVTPTADGTVTVSLPADQALNIGNNGNTVSTGNISLTYDGTAPFIKMVTNPADGMYNAGTNKTLAFDVSFSEPVNVTGTPTLAIVIGGTTKVLNGTLTGGSDLHFEYTVADGDQDMDGIAYGAFTATVNDLAGNPATIDNTKFTAMPNVLVNTTHPGVVLSTTAASLINQSFTVTAQFTEAVHDLTAAAFTVGNGTASNLTSTDQITYAFTVTPTADGTVTVSLPADQALNIGNNGNTVSTGNISLTYDGTAPFIKMVTNPADGMYNAGTNKTLAFDVSFSEPVNVTGTPTLAIVIGGTTKVLNGTLTGVSDLHFEYTVADGDQDMDGIAYGAFTATVNDLAGNPATIDNSKFGAMPNVLVNTTHPGVVLSTTAASLTNQPFTATATFTEAVHNLTIGGFSVGNATISDLTSTDQITYTFTVTPTADGTVTVSLPADQAMNIGNNGNTVSTGNISLTYDGTAPFIKMVTNPADGMYNAGTNKTLAFDVSFSEPVNVTGTPTLAIVIGGTTKVLNGTLTGGNTLHFEYTVADGDQDMDGIAYGAFTATVNDLAGNPATIDNSKFGAMPNVLVNTTHPSVVLSTTAPALTNKPFTVTARFSEAVSGLVVTDFTVSNGTASNLLSTDQITYTFTVTPTADGSVTVSLPADQAMNIGNNGNNASTGNINLTYDATAPIVTSVDVPAPGTYKIGDQLSFIVHWSKVVILDPATTPYLGLTVGNGTPHAAYVSGSPSNAYTFTYTVQEGDLAGNGIAISSGSIQNVTSITDAATNVADLTLNSIGALTAVNVDGVKPVISAVTNPADGVYNAGNKNTLAFDVVFSEPINVTGMPTLAIVVGTDTKMMNGTLTGGNTLHFQYTVADGDKDMDGITYGAFTATVNDLAGNPAVIDNSKFGAMTNVLVNTTHPSVVLSTTAPALTNKPFTVTATFSEAVSGLIATDFIVTNGSVSNLTSTDQITYTFTVIPTANGAVTVSLPADQAVNIGNNGNTPSTGNIYLTYDGIAPVVTSVSAPATATYKIGDQLTFIVNWSKMVTLDPATTPYLELTIGSTVQHAAYVGGNNSNAYTFAYTVQEGDLDNNGITISQNKILNVTAITDAATNAADLTLNNIGTLTTVNVDGVKPVISAVKNPADGMYNASNSTLKFDVVFSEPVNVTGTTKLSVVIGNSTKVLTGALVNGNTLHFEYYVAAGDLDMDGIAYGTFDVSGATITDIAGNPATIDNSKFSAMPQVLVNTIYPSVSLTSAAPALINKPVEITATFSEAVTGLTAAKFYVTNGTAGNLTTTDNITYQVTITPAADGVVSIMLPAGAAMNIGNNANTVSNTLAFTYDGTAPTVTSVTMPADKYYNEGSVLQFVVHMSEPVVVTGTPALNFKIGGTAVAADYTSGTQDMVFTYTVPAGINGAADFSSAAISLNGGTVKDPAGNNAKLTLNGIPAVTNININTAHATVVIAATAASRVNTPVDATITFSEAVSGFAASAITVTNGAVTSLTSTDNITYKATIQATADGAVTVMVPAGVAQNVSNNGNQASNTISFTFDGTAPVITGTQFSVNGDATSNTQIGVLSATEASGILKNWTITEDPTNGAFAIDANGNITVNDARALNNASGTIVTIKVTVTDGLNMSQPALVPIKVILMYFNQQPTLDPINDQSICVDKATHTIQLTNISAVEADQTYALTISTDQPLFDVLTVSHSGLVTYTLKAAATSAVAHITVTIKDNGGTLNHAVDSLQRTFTFTVLPTPAVTITADKPTTLSKGDDITLTATGGDIYAWAQVDGIISGQFTDRLHARVQANTIYTVTVTNIFNCSNTTDIAVTANVDFKVDANNILTPNGDGINDKWVIKNLDSYPDNELMIYDRAGRLVYQRKNYSNDWDGTSAGNPLAEGTYYYILTIQKSTKATKGYITIIR